MAATQHGRATKIPLVVAQYTIYGHPRRTEHWSLVAPINKQYSHIYQLVGNTDTFQYSYTYIDALLESRSLCGGVQIGYINSDLAGTWLKEKLREVNVVRSDPNFDCQDWLIDAIHLLKDFDGIIGRGVSTRWIREELAADKERWETGGDTVFERLFP